MIKTLLASLAISLIATVAFAQTGGDQSNSASSRTGGGSADQVARDLANPNSPLASLTFKNQFTWYRGDLPGADGLFNYSLVFQPVFPFDIGTNSRGAKQSVFVRPAIPFLFRQPVFSPSQARFRRVSGIGDIGFDLAYGVTEKNGLLWAVGVVGTLPTASSSSISGRQFRIGPEALVAKFNKWGIYGIFPSHQWSVGGWSGGSFSATTVQGFLIFFLGDGWTVGSTPIMSYDWRANEWSIPLNLTISKTVKFGKLPVKFGLELNYFVARPNAFGSEWRVIFSVTPVVPNFIASLFNR